MKINVQGMNKTSQNEDDEDFAVGKPCPQSECGTCSYLIEETVYLSTYASLIPSNTPHV